MKVLLKGILCGIGGVSPGLSGSVMMVLFGLYEKTVNSIGTFFKNPKANFRFLFPLFCGIGIGILIFGKIVAFLLDKFEMPTRFLFLGLVVGTLPMFYKEVKKKKFNKKYYFVMFGSFLLGLFLMVNNSDMFVQIKTLNFIQSVLMGLLIAASTIIPGIDSAVMLSSVGLYEIYIKAIDTLNFSILIPAVIGAGIGIIIFSFIMSILLKKYHTITYSIIFGFFLSIIPSVLEGKINFGFNFISVISIICAMLGFTLSFRMENINKKSL